MKKLKILYLHNSNQWAIYNVGLLWLKKQTNLDVTFINYKKLTDEREFEKYDYVWFGYFLMYTKYNYNPLKSIVTIHDPMELFPENSNWKKLKMLHDRILVLRTLKHVVVISKEIQIILKNLNIESNLINTTSHLPFRKYSLKEARLPITVTTVCKEYSRKNIALLEEIKDNLSYRNDILFDYKIGNIVLDKNEYLKLLDKCHIYLCTSYQEGGPLPAFDAIKRGLVVITTPVGQIQDIITNGINGFVCTEKGSFIEKIIFLAEHLDELNNLRNASRRIHKNAKRNLLIEGQVNNFIQQLVKSK